MGRFENIFKFLPVYNFQKFTLQSISIENRQSFIDKQFI